MAILHVGITGQRTLPQMFSKLRKPERAEAFAAPHLAEAVQSLSKWAWTLETDAGEFIASAAIVPDTGRRGWLVAYPGERIRRAADIMPLVRLLNDFRESGAVYDELRSWVASEDRRAVRFAEWVGMVYDCGPATGLSPTGRDMSLYIWRRS